LGDKILGSTPKTKSTKKENTMIGLHKFHTSLPQNIGAKEVVRYVAIALLGLIGVSALLQSIAVNPSANSRQASPNSSYSSSVYGK
jgi:hypothetical protein